MAEITITHLLRLANEELRDARRQLLLKPKPSRERNGALLRPRTTVCDIADISEDRDLSRSLTQILRSRDGFFTSRMLPERLPQVR